MDSQPAMPIRNHAAAVFRATVMAKALGYCITVIGAKVFDLGSFLRSHSCFSSLCLYIYDDAYGTLSSEALIAAIEALLLQSLGTHYTAAAVFSDAIVAAPFPRWLRTLISPAPYVDRREAASCLNALQSDEIRAIALVQSLRVFVRAAVVVGRRYLSGHTYMKPHAIFFQSSFCAVDTICVSLAALTSTTLLLRKTKMAPYFTAWAAVYGAFSTAACGISGLISVRLNQNLQAFIARHLYDAVPGFRHPRQRLFDIPQLDAQFQHLTANELSELSQFANEALRSPHITQNTRLHAVRYLASLTAYVKAVNSGMLTRAAAKRRHSGRAPFAKHVFTDGQLARTNVVGSAPFVCVSCSGDFASGDQAELLQCGHLVHSPQPRGATKSMNPCNNLAADWCPACARPVHALSAEERLEIFVEMRSYVDTLASEWQTCQVIPESLNNAEWGIVAQYARKHKVVEGEVPLDVVPCDYQPGAAVWSELPMASLLWALRLQPSEAMPRVFVLQSGW